MFENSGPFGLTKPIQVTTEYSKTVILWMMNGAIGVISDLEATYERETSLWASVASLHIQSMLARVFRKAASLALCYLPCLATT